MRDHQPARDPNRAQLFCGNCNYSLDFSVKLGYNATMRSSAHESCVICGDPTDGRATCSRECFRQYQYLRSENKLALLDAYVSVKEVTRVKRILTISSARFKQTCPFCERQFLTRSQKPKNGWACWECEETAIKSRRAQNKAIMTQRRLLDITTQIPTEANPMTDLYNLRESNEPGTYIITKFDKHFNVMSSYLMTQSECACPQGQRPQCRHRKMLPLFRQKKHIGDGWFLNYDTRQWFEPVNDDIDAHTAAPAIGEPEAEILPPASTAPATARPSKPMAGAQTFDQLIVRPL